jgi:hypothetical protein
LCTCWAVTDKHPLLRTTPPHNYPEDKVLTDGKIESFKLTFVLLRKAVDDSHAKIVNRTWSIKQAYAFIRTYCIPHTAINEMMKCASNCLTELDIHEIDTFEDTEEYTALMEEKQNDIVSYYKWVFPVMWDDSIPTDIYAEVPMHLLFLGIVKTIMMDVCQWKIVKGKNLSFIKYATGILNAIEKLQLHWLKLLPYSNKKFRGWVGANYVAMGRLLKWFYHPLITNFPGANLGTSCKAHGSMDYQR